ncbi:MAG: cytochrome c oxidase subunit 4 [Actinomycetota bacterium]
MTSRILLSLAGFLVVAGAVYGPTSHELTGGPLLLAASATFCYLGLVARSVARRSGAEGEGHAAEEPEAVVAPTIWPFGFAIAAAIMMFGLVLSRWILIAAAIAFALSAAGWLREVARGHAHADED